MSPMEQYSLLYMTGISLASPDAMMQLNRKIGYRQVPGCVLWYNLLVTRFNIIQCISVCDA